MLDLKIRRIGNSLGVVLPKEALALLRVEEGDKIHLTQDADSVLRLTPYDPEFEAQMEQAIKGMKQYRNTLHHLAK
ncbi:Prevent host death protein, Phd antitoxin [hydrothermal vent metagenome]|uniref:Prevent host death protein, Phd antitoxin n=1 Tax=hydrothermal vent metagenome TaxID=652676 RepID=A0A3B0W1Y7_9ZZZZ